MKRRRSRESEIEGLVEMLNSSHSLLALFNITNHRGLHVIGYLRVLDYMETRSLHIASLDPGVYSEKTGCNCL